MKTKICPSCGAEHNLDATYCGCGYKWKRNSIQSDSVSYDSMHGCCEVNGFSGRCHYPGSMSRSLQGGGPWICKEHYLDDSGEKTEDIIKESHIKIPNPDYSFKARKQASQSVFLDELANSPFVNAADKEIIKRRISQLINWVKT